MLTVSQAIFRHDVSNIEAVWCISVGYNPVSMKNLAKVIFVEHNDSKNDAFCSRS